MRFFAIFSVKTEANSNKFGIFLIEKNREEYTGCGITVIDRSAR